MSSVAISIRVCLTNMATAEGFLTSLVRKKTTRGVNKPACREQLDLLARTYYLIERRNSSKHQATYSPRHSEGKAWLQAFNSKRENPINDGKKQQQQNMAIQLPYAPKNKNQPNNGAFRQRLVYFWKLTH
ncbi:hypothetical protein RRG08_061331 [Elysia crispata]|uniref:Uncharacterized protein n=1 Tax=Elysia crispata TaxID=231223 RepID=A0AAE1DYA6_9GAST|nr:hypothetical protein RRG08_061331 [Elysia crispata]